MKRADVEKNITALVEPLLEGTELTLTDVEYVREKDWYLRIFIDKPGGIEIDDCQYISEKLEEILDKLDIIEDKYVLEVSSPGIDRPLKNDADLKTYYGKKVDVKFFSAQDGAKEWVAVLESHTADTVALCRVNKNIVAKVPVSIERKLISCIRPHIDF